MYNKKIILDISKFLNIYNIKHDIISLYGTNSISIYNKKYRLHINDLMDFISLDILNIDLQTIYTINFNKDNFNKIHNEIIVLLRKYFNTEYRYYKIKKLI